MTRYCGVLVVWVLMLVVVEVIIIITLDNRTRKHMDQEKRTRLRNTEEVSDVEKLVVKTSPTKTSASDISNRKPRLNVIILTHMRSGSTFTGNVFNFHPDVFYLYEPLHKLRRNVYMGSYLGEWAALDEKDNEAYKIDFSNFLRGIFKCNFTGQNTLSYLFPPFIRNSKEYLSWRKTIEIFSEESVTKVCQSKKITVLKMMQTRLPREIGIRELQRVCDSEPAEFECLIIHLVRDPRAVLSSHIKQRFFLGSGLKKLITLTNTSREGKEIMINNARTICSLVEENLNYINKEWSNWFKSRYILVRYEDIPGDLLKAVHRLYNFTGLAIDDSIKEWILKTKKGSDVKRSGTSAFNITENNDKRTEHWRYHIGTSLTTEFEEACWGLMYMVGYISIGGSEHVLLDAKKKLWTEKVPFSLEGEEMAPYNW